MLGGFHDLGCLVWRWFALKVVSTGEQVQQFMIQALLNYMFIMDRG